MGARGLRIGGAAGDLDRISETDTADLDTSGDLSDNTIESYDRALEVFQEWLAEVDPAAAALGFPLMLVGVRPPVVRRWRKWLSERHKAATVNVRLAGLSRWYTVLLEEGHVSRNPVAGIRRMRVSPFSPLAVLSEAEGTEIVNVCAGDSSLRGRRDEALIGLALSCGLRKAELHGLDVDSLGAHQGHDVVVFTRKGGREARTVLTPRTLRRIARWKDAAQLGGGPLWRPVFGPPTRPGDSAWRAGAGRLSRGAIDALVSVRAAQAGIEARITPHCLRRSACDWLWERGVDPQLIKGFMGHASITTTDRYRLERQELDRHAAHLLGWV